MIQFYRNQSTSDELTKGDRQPKNNPSNLSSDIHDLTNEELLKNDDENQDDISQAENTATENHSTLEAKQKRRSTGVRNKVIVSYAMNANLNGDCKHLDPFSALYDMWHDPCDIRSRLRSLQSHPRTERSDVSILWPIFSTIEFAHETCVGNPLKNQ